MNILSLPNHLIQNIVEFGYTSIVNNFIADDLDKIGCYLDVPISFPYEKVVIPARNLARKLIADPGDMMVKFLIFENYTVPLDVALGGYFKICAPFLSYARIVERYSVSGGRTIPGPEIVIPNKITHLVNNNSNTDEFSIRLAILNIAKELNHPAVEDDYQKMVWNMVKYGVKDEDNLILLCRDMSALLRGLRYFGFSLGDGTPIRQYWWRALVGHFGISDDEFNLYKEEISEIVNNMRTFNDVLNQQSYRGDDLFRERINSIIELLRINFRDALIKSLTKPAKPSKFRLYKGSNLKKSLEVGVKEKHTPIILVSRRDQVQPLPLRRYSSSERKFLTEFKTGMDIDNCLSRFSCLNTLREDHHTAAIFMQNLFQLSDEDIIKFKLVVRVLAQERGFEDLINCNVLFPKFLFCYNRLFDKDDVKRVYDILGLNIPYKSVLTREQRIRFMVENNEYNREYMKFRIKSSWIPIMGEALKIQYNLDEFESVNRLYCIFDWVKFAKSVSGRKFVESNKGDDMVINRLRTILNFINKDKRVKIPIEFKEALY